MKISASTYLFKPTCKTNLYCFRAVVPPDLRGIVGEAEIRYSLRTGLLSEAKYRALRMASFVQRFFREIRKGGIMSELSKAEIQKLIRDHLKDAIEETELYRASIEKPLSEQEFIDDLDVMSLLHPALRDTSPPVTTGQSLRRLTGSLTKKVPSQAKRVIPTSFSAGKCRNAMLSTWVSMKKSSWRGATKSRGTELSTKCSDRG